MSKIVLAVVLFGMWVAAAPANAQCVQSVGKSAAGIITKQINTLADFATTSCIPTEDFGRCAILCVSEHRITNVQRTKELWLMVAAATGGKVAREHGLQHFSSIQIADRHALEARQRYTLPVPDASRLQVDISTDKITLEQFRDRVLRAYKLVPISK